MKSKNGTKKLLIVAGFDRSLLLFRSELIKSWLDKSISVTTAAPGSEVEIDLRKLNVKYCNIPLNRTDLNPIKDLFLLYKLILLIRHEKPEYLFLYTVKSVIYGSLASMGMKNCRVYSMITGLGYVFTEASGSGNLLRSLVEQLYRMALKFNDIVFFQNPDDSALFANRGLVRPEKVLLINGSGVNLEYYHMAELPEKKLIFLMIARLLKEKGVREFIQAAELVKQKYPEVRFILVGWSFSENLSSISEAEVEKWKNEGVVDVLSEMEDVRPMIASSSVYVLPSYREGTPRTVLEAMAMGRPIITSDAPGCRETVEEGVNGFLVPVRDVDALAEAMEKFIREPELVAKMGAESRRIAEEKYDVHKVNAVINQAMGLI